MELLWGQVHPPCLCWRWVLPPQPQRHNLAAAHCAHRAIKAAAPRGLCAAGASTGGVLVVNGAGSCSSSEQGVAGAAQGSCMRLQRGQVGRTQAGIHAIQTNPDAPHAAIGCWASWAGQPVQHPLPPIHAQAHVAVVQQRPLGCWHWGGGSSSSSSASGSLCLCALCCCCCCCCCCHCTAAGLPHALLKQAIDALPSSSTHASPAGHLQHLPHPVLPLHPAHHACLCQHSSRVQVQGSAAAGCHLAPCPHAHLPLIGLQGSWHASLAQAGSQQGAIHQRLVGALALEGAHGVRCIPHQGHIWQAQGGHAASQVHQAGGPDAARLGGCQESWAGGVPASSGCQGQSQQGLTGQGAYVAPCCLHCLPSAAVGRAGVGELPHGEGRGGGRGGGIGHGKEPVAASEGVKAPGGQQGVLAGGQPQDEHHAHVREGEGRGGCWGGAWGWRQAALQSQGPHTGAQAIRAHQHTGQHGRVAAALKLQLQQARGELVVGGQAVPIAHSARRQSLPHQAQQVRPRDANVAALRGCHLLAAARLLAQGAPKVPQDAALF